MTTKQKSRATRFQEAKDMVSDAKSAIKVKVKNITHEDLERIKQIQINKARAFYNHSPFATKVYMAMKTRLPFEFIKSNWKEITGNDFE